MLLWWRRREEDVNDLSLSQPARMLTLMAGEDSYGTAHVPLLQGFFCRGGGHGVRSCSEKKATLGNRGYATFSIWHAQMELDWSSTFFWLAEIFACVCVCVMTDDTIRSSPTLTHFRLIMCVPLILLLLLLCLSSASGEYFLYFSFPASVSAPEKKKKI